MTDKNDKASHNHNGKLVAGLAAGVAIGAAGVLLSDKKNQQKVAKKLDDVRNWSDKSIELWKDKGMDMKEDMDDVADDLEDAIDKSQHDVKTKAHHVKAVKVN